MSESAPPVTGRRTAAALGPRRFSGARTVRARLVLLVLACMLPATLAVAMVMLAAYREGRAAMIERAQSAAGSMMSTVDHELADAIAELQALATSPLLASGDLAGFHAQARRVVPYQVGNVVVLSDASGQQLVNTLLPYGVALPRDADPALRRVFERKAPVISDLFIGGVMRRPLVAVQVPVLQGGRVAYGLSMGFFPERIAEIMSGVRPAPEWVVSIFDSSGTVVARTHEAERFVGRKGAAGILAAMRGAPQGAVETDTLEGTAVLATFTRSTQTGWSVAVGIPKRVLLAPLERWLGWLAAAAAALFILGLLAARQVARRIAESIDALVAPAVALGRGEAVTVAPLHLVEAEAVAAALARASRLLQSRTAERDEAARSRETLRRQTERLELDAQHDALTGLMNRVGFSRALETRLQACRRDGGCVTVFFIDIDDFKLVNDGHGHAVGDELLRLFATRLRAGVRERDVAARLGGDEFAALIDGLAPQESLPLARALIERLSRPYAIRQHAVNVSACIGIAGHSDGGASAEALLEAADAAMYRAKAAGKRSFTLSGSAPL
jgi:diguanylate cyclase (GGDEF)-like protein